MSIVLLILNVVLIEFHIVLSSAFEKLSYAFQTELDIILSWDFVLENCVKYPVVEILLIAALFTNLGTELKF